MLQTVLGVPSVVTFSCDYLSVKYYKQFDYYLPESALRCDYLSVKYYKQSLIEKFEEEFKLWLPFG